MLLKLGSAAACEELSPVAGIAGVIVTDELSKTAALKPPCPVIATADSSTSDLIDVRIESDQSLDSLIEGIERSSIAAATLVQLTRLNSRSSVINALCAESLAYSSLQHSAKFEDWLASDKPTNIKYFSEPAILIDRTGDELTLTLNRPANRNAWSTDMRDALAEHLQYAFDDSSIANITLRANGPAFSAGGDLTEFGSARDAGIAHVSRQTRSPAVLMHLLTEKITAMVHGACVGAGIELPAFAGRIRAQSDAFFQLPEVSFGLIPGAGGTASILKRIGRSRFNYMGLTGERINVETALKWRLIDEINDSESV
ncbi:MAG: enoyl-CoA hydratase/isomerase family protein [Gammaproteobacteria bacterium]|nr:enoyl-CoA hydratase/isomerase family protein [Gammaproteobacteria bacterium]